MMKAHIYYIIQTLQLVAYPTYKSRNSIFKLTVYFSIGYVYRRQNRISIIQKRFDFNWKTLRRNLSDATLSQFLALFSL